MTTAPDKWNSGDPYEYFMGRWSRQMAPAFLAWLNPPIDLRWLDVGCGTGALSQTICQQYQPAHISCVDPSEKFLDKARQTIVCNADYITGSASHLPLPGESIDIVVSGLAFNFFDNPLAALNEMKRVLGNKGIIAAYVWDYARRMEFLRLFWDTAVALDHHVQEFDEGNRFPLCNTEKLKIVFEEAGLLNIETTYIDIETVFKNFDDYWLPFLGAQGPAPTYLASLDQTSQDNIKEALRKKLPINTNGEIPLIARAIAIRATAANKEH